MAGGRLVASARRLLGEALDVAAPEADLTRAARDVVARLGTPERLAGLVRDLAADGAAGGDDTARRARLSYRHVLGFDKLLLIDGGPHHMLRAHVWRPGARAPEDIHNHRSPLASSVVRGSLRMELFAPATDPRAGRAAARYRESLSDGAADWLLEPAGAARLDLAHVAEYPAGSSYALPSHTLHRVRTTAAAPTVTLFLETGAGRRRHTDVFLAADADPHAAEVAKTPLDATEYVTELEALAALLTRG
ncbi:cupin domain-containing protein [Streptomyces beihaiensis]|uniref:Cysteine dioxygenase n=1 Tax=Streptomyces beihaiensis TaxID=2984495 RepID=A0ABT3TV16_9ACTN|nr:hypothetical protein [Streptomyces beihaiensis]MCX3060879.1 hypothetical protein [Streptomyces beihaiensis]